MCKYCEPKTTFFVNAEDIDNVDDETLKLLGDSSSKQFFKASFPIICEFPKDNPIEEMFRGVWISGNILFAETSNREYGHQSTYINFCPMCGRSLAPVRKGKAK